MLHCINRYLSTFLATLLLVLVGCTKYIVRDTTVYQTELNQYDAWATKQAALLKVFAGKTCVCNEVKEFTTPECSQAADFIQTVQARASWHKAMSLYLAGITDERPSKDPPIIPPNADLCPGGAP